MIYLDNAATTFPKPDCVNAEMTKCIREYCGNPGRSGHILSLRASEKIYECRQTLASFFGSDKPENVVFTLNATYALNLAIKSLYTPGSHVLISNMEHNSVYRPVWELKARGEVTFDTFNVLQPTDRILAELRAKCTQNTKLLVMMHASNLCGKVFPIREIGSFCRKHGILFVVDAAQSAGVIDIDMKRCFIDALCAPAHKGLYGPQGLGFVIFGDTQPMRTVIEGGNGINSLSAAMDGELPERFEGGTMPTPAIAALDASVRFIRDVGVRKINAHETALAAELCRLLSRIPGSILRGTRLPETGIVLYENADVSVNRIAEGLNARDICTRGGFHCCPLGHAALRTGKEGAIRISMGYYNTIRDIDAVADAIGEICANAK